MKNPKVTSHIRTVTRLSCLWQIDFTAADVLLLDITAATELSDQPHLRSTTLICLVVCVENQKGQKHGTKPLWNSCKIWITDMKNLKMAKKNLPPFKLVHTCHLKLQNENTYHSHSHVASLVETEATKVTTLKVTTTASKKLTSNQTCITKTATGHDLLSGQHWASPWPM